MVLWKTLVERQAHALRRGAMLPIRTEFEFVEEAGVQFVVRAVSNLVRKGEAKREEGRRAESTNGSVNPFLPYEEDLFVADVSKTHVGLLNKFNVLDHHLLIVTREFEEQTSLLTRRDFEAMWICMAGFRGLSFYNAGEAAGASQRHKHLQMVPLPLAPGAEGVPVDLLVRRTDLDDPAAVVPELPFRHAVASVADCPRLSPHDAAGVTLDRYHAMLLRLDVGESPYNLLVTREWMLLVPRSRHCFGSISMNALGFAGALLVPEPRQIESVRRHGPMALLRGVAMDQSPR